MRTTRPWLGLCVVLALCLLQTGFALAAPPSHPHYTDQVIIKFKDNASQNEKNQLLDEMQATKIRGFGRIKAALHKIEGLTVEEAIARYGTHPKVEYVEPNYIIDINETPNDSRFNELWGMLNTGQTGGTAGADISATNAWDVFTGSPNVVIGVIDTGVDYNHPDLAANMWTNPGEIPGNGIDDDNNGFVDDIHGWDFRNNDNDPMDDHGHGTHCSGTIGGVGNNGIGVAGVNWNVKIMALKFLSAGGSGSTADAVAAVEYATQNGVHLTSNSWGGGGFSQALFDAIDDARLAGQLFVAAAGNSSSNNDVSPHYPSNYNLDNVISVAATDHNDALASFSSYGATTVDLAAPGVDILSTLPGSSYGLASGTSMATPHVAGVAGLVFGRFPAINAADAKSLILNFADPLPNLAGVVLTGARLNAFFPIADPDTIPPGAITDLAAIGVGSNWVELGWTATGDDGSSGTASRYEMRYATYPLDGLNFETGMEVANEPDPQTFGSPESMQVDGLDFSTLYFFAVRALDEFGNPGEVVNSASASTLGAPDIDATPTLLTETLLTGASATQQVTLSNVGLGTLDFSIPTPALLGIPQPTHAATVYLKGETDPRVGDPVLQGSGGPDGFGYRWFDSNDPFGPIYIWNDISGTGSLAIDAGDDVAAGPFPVGFDFPYYGGTFSEFYVNSNGSISMSQPHSTFSNQQLPSGGGAAHMIAPFWDDLVVGAGSNVYYQSTGTSLIVQWDGVAHYGSGGPYTFQAILNTDGSIVFQYENMNAPLNSATIGFQNGAKNDGLSVAFNTDYVENGLAIRIAAVPQWATVSPTEGTVYAPNSTTLDVTFDASGLLGGNYDGTLRILSNDPDEPEFDIALDLTVIGAPDLAVEPSFIDFGGHFIGATPTETFAVQNIGTDFLTVHSIVSSDPAFTLDTPNAVIPPKSAILVTATFSPAAAVPYTSTVTVTSNDPDSPIATVDLAGLGLVPPSFQVNPAALASNLLTGETEVQQLTLSNSGGSDLTWDASLEFQRGTQMVTLAAPVIVPESTEDGEVVDQVGRTTPIQAMLADLTGTEILWDRSHGQTSTSSWSAFIADLEARGATVTMSTDPITPALLAGFDILWSVDTSSAWDPAELTALDAWVNGGGGVVLEGDNTASVPIFNDILTTLGTGIEYSDVNGSAGTSTNIYPHETTDGVSGVYFTGNIASIPTIAAPGFPLVDDDEGVGAAAGCVVGAGRVFATSDEIFQSSRMDDADNQLFGNQVFDWLASAAFMTIAPTAGTVPAGGNAVIDVTFDATGLFGGDYLGFVNISSNDPLNSEVSVQADLHVTGVPLIAVEPAAVDFGQVMIGYPSIRNLTISNTGTDVLTVNGWSMNNPDFGTNLGVPLNLDPNGQALITVNFNPSSVGIENAIFTIASNDPFTPNATVDLTGEGIVAPTAGVNPTFLYSDLFTGETETQQVTVSNTGGSDLVWETGLQFARAKLPVTLAAPVIVPESMDDGAAIDQTGRTTPIQVQLADLTGVEIMWDRSHGQTSTSSWATIIGDFEARGATVTINNDELTPALLANFDVLWSVDTSGSWSNVELLALSDWVNAGGSILLEGDNTSSVGHYNDILTALGAGIEFSTVDGSSGTTTNIYPHATTDGVSGVYFTANIASIPNVTAPGFPLVDDDEGVGAAAGSTVGAGRIFATSDEIFQNSRMDDADNQLFGNQVMDWLASTAFMAVDPSEGVIPAGGSAVLDVTFDATGLFGGDYNANLNILSNDPLNGLLTVNAHLHVTGVPLLSTDPEALDFGLVYVGYSGDLPLTVTNSGTDLLSVTDIASTTGDFSVTPTAFDLNPTESTVVTVTFAPLDDGPKAADLVFTSNANNAPNAVPMTGDALYPPDITVSPDPLIAAAPPGGTKEKTMQICNDGLSDLVWSLVDGEDPVSVTVHEELVLPRGEPDPRPGILGSGGPDNYGYTWIDSDEPGGPVYDWVDITGVGTPVPFPSYVIDDNVGPLPIGFDFPYYGNSFNELYVSNNGWVSFTNSTLTSYSNQPLPNSGSSVPENMLAIWWDDMVYDESDGNEAYYYNDGSRFIIEYYVRRIGAFTPPFYRFQIILYPNGTIVYQYHTLGVTQGSSTIGMQNGDKDDGLLVVYNDSSYPHEGLAIQFSAAPDWLSATPTSGVIPAGECVDIDVTFDASELEAGDYTGEITITSNDPDEGTYAVPVTLHVGEIMADWALVSPNTLNLDSHGNFMTAQLQLPAPYSTADIVLETVELQDVVPALSQAAQLSQDVDGDGIPDAQFKFDRTAAEGVLPEGDAVEVIITGEVRDVIWFRATDTIRVIRPQMAMPNGGEVFFTGDLVTIEWTNPENYTVRDAEIFFSADDGATWEMVASGISGSSYDWTVPTTVTREGRLRVFIDDNVGPLGWDTSDEVFEITDGVTATDSPRVYALKQNVPNPFNPSTDIAFSLPKPGSTTLQIFDLRGRVVRTLLSRDMEAGHHAVTWWGKDDSGRQVASGVYFYKIRSGSFEAQHRMVLLK